MSKERTHEDISNFVDGIVTKFSLPSEDIDFRLGPPAFKGDYSPRNLLIHMGYDYQELCRSGWEDIDDIAAFEQDQQILLEEGIPQEAIKEIEIFIRSAGQE